MTGTAIYPSFGGGILPRPGQYYGADPAVGDGVVALTLNLMASNSFPLGKATRFDRIALEVTVNIPTANYRLGVYADDGTDFPGAIVLDAGLIDAHTAIGIQEIIIDLTLSAGLYWLTAVPQTAVATVRARSAINPRIGQPAASNFNATGWAASGIVGAFPSTYPLIGAGASAVQIAIPKVMLRAA